MEIPINEYRRLKNKLLTRIFVFLPITIILTVYLYSTLLQGEAGTFNELLFLIVVTFFGVFIMWVTMDLDKQIKKEKQREIKIKNKSKKRLAIEYGLLTLLFIVFIAYTV